MSWLVNAPKILRSSLLLMVAKMAVIKTSWSVHPNREHMQKLYSKCLLPMRRDSLHRTIHIQMVCSWNQSAEVDRNQKIRQPSKRQWSSNQVCYASINRRRLVWLSPIYLYFWTNQRTVILLLKWWMTYFAVFWSENIQQWFRPTMVKTEYALENKLFPFLVHQPFWLDHTLHERQLSSKYSQQLVRPLSKSLSFRNDISNKWWSAQWWRVAYQPIDTMMARNTKSIQWQLSMWMLSYIIDHKFNLQFRLDWHNSERTKALTTNIYRMMMTEVQWKVARTVHCSWISAESL